ncbi:hypothetical protein ABZ383_13690 [Streptomyces sp. NPDC005900]|uniref:hypothetical protein n=1 Tax=unclassified Streptomyces TaxID=2593676 RepID=UPI0033EF4F72
MRALPVRRIATSALCATLVLGTAGPALALPVDGTPRDQTWTAHRAPAPAPETMLAQARQLHDAAGVITPTTELLTAVLKAPGHKLSPEDVEKYYEAMWRAVEATGAKAPGAPADPKAPADPRASALTALQKANTTLLEATAAGDVAAVRTHAPALVTGMVNVVAATLVVGGLPTPDLAGLSPLPNAPGAQAPQGLPPATLPHSPAVPGTPAP